MTWILLRGLMREARHWGAFPATLRNALPGANVVTPDLPGNGHWFRERSPSTISAMVEHCRQRLQNEGIAPPYRLLTLSLGGMAAIDWSTRHPHEISHAVLINTSMRPHNPFYQRLRPSAYPSVLGLALRGSDMVARERTILHLSSASRVHPALLNQWTGYARDCPVSRANALRQLLAAARFRAVNAPPQTKLLLLASAADWLVHPQCSRSLANAWRAPLHLHPHAGHDLPLDDGPWVAEQVRRWVNLPA